MKLSNLILVAGGLMAACSVPKESKTDAPVEAIEVEQNPPAEGFNITGSDPSAILLADQVMEAMGGRSNWNNTRYLSWNFFGSRKHLWDKWTGDIRIESQRSDFKVLMNLRSMKGQVWKDGILLNQPDSVSKYLEAGKSMWINDSYWLVMPYKLKDSGVTLKYAREDTTMLGVSSDVVMLTFQEVGRTPDNKYEVWIDRESKLVSEWAYFRSFEDAEPAFRRPWGDYQTYGNILLSSERGDRDLSEVRVLTSVPAGVFEDFAVTLP